MLKDEIPVVLVPLTVAVGVVKGAAKDKTGIVLVPATTISLVVPVMESTAPPDPLTP